MTIKLVKHFSLSILSSIILGIGCTFLILSELGSDSITTFVEGIANFFSINISLTNILVNIVIFIIALLLKSKHTGFSSLLFPMGVSMGISLGMIIVPEVHSLPIKSVYLILGILLLVLAIGLGSQCDTGKNPYDSLLFELSDQFQLSYSKVRTGFDALMLIIGYVLGGSFGIGTILCILFIGTLANSLIKYLETNRCLINYLEN